MSVVEMKENRNMSLLEYALRRGGVIKGAKSVEVVITWAIATQELGHELGSEDTGSLSAAVREFGEYWRLSERTAWRDLHRFRAVFPEEESPARLAAVVIRTAGERRLRREDVATLGMQVAFA